MEDARAIVALNLKTTNKIQILEIIGLFVYQDMMPRREILLCMFNCKVKLKPKSLILWV
jgi:hypothetical protein